MGLTCRCRDGGSTGGVWLPTERSALTSCFLQQLATVVLKNAVSHEDADVLGLQLLLQEQLFYAVAPPPGGFDTSLVVAVDESSDFTPPLKCLLAWCPINVNEVHQ